MDPLIITAALTGAEATREQQPNLPVTPEDLIEAAVACREAGAAMVHLHVRAEDGTPSSDPKLFRRAVAGIRERTDLIVQVSTGGAVGMSENERLGGLAAGPDMASLTPGSVNFGSDVFLNPPDLVRRFAARMQDLGIKPEIEIFDHGMIPIALSLQAEGLVPSQAHFDLVLGVPGGAPADFETAMLLMRQLPAGSTYSIAAVGRGQLPLNTFAILAGAHVRTGLEDNIYYSRGRKAASNAELVARIARIAGELERPLATPAQARDILHLAGH
jgi:3-keto-5-aminohexanoate cleavage enzyme